MTSMTESVSIWGINREELAKKFSDYGISSSHLKKAIAGIYRSPFKEWNQIPPLPKKMEHVFGFQKKDKSSFPVKVKRYHISKYDLSVKMVIEFSDHREVETVIMPESNRITLCVSSQVGCAQGCIFCHTGRMGLLRNLHSDEIIAQVLLANDFIQSNLEWRENLDLTSNLEGVQNIVFMGMGEPLDNLKEVDRSITILQDPWGLGIAPKRITVSTAGHLDGLRSIVKLQPKISIAFSLHNADEKMRRKLMPITKRFPLGEVTSFLKSQFGDSSRGCMIQYTVIRNTNDSEEDARKLVKLLYGINCKINLIPLNPIGVNRLESPDQNCLFKFRDLLHEAGMRVLIRYSKGQDIGAACGQLVK